MPRPRKELVDLSKTPYYHVTSRCVRRAYLCGTDLTTGTSYEHRKEWIEERIRLLSSVFTIDICSYAVMSNHYHIVLRLNPDEADTWSVDETIKRWRCLYKGPKLIKRYADGETLTSSERLSVSKLTATYKERLTNLSWFMKALNEPIARMANKEDDCSGHFWESRFCSQGLFTDAALIACMAYVDMNPYRAGLVNDPFKAKHTSLRERTKPAFILLDAVRNQFKSYSLRDFCVTLKPLMSFTDEPTSTGSAAGVNLPYSFDDYCELISWTSDVKSADHRSSIKRKKPKMLVQIGLTKPEWLIDSQHFEIRYRRGAFKHTTE